MKEKTQTLSFSFILILFSSCFCSKKKKKKFGASKLKKASSATLHPAFVLKALKRKKMNFDLNLDLLRIWLDI
jgi:hypothetical protein